MNLRAGLVLLMLLCGLPSGAAETRILKVLPLYLDSEGRHALSPSLFERDAYQDKLRRRPELQAGLKLEVQFQAAAPSSSTNLQLKVELRTNQAGKPVETPLTAAVQPTGLVARWQSLRIDGEKFKTLGSLLAWRATLWDGDRQVAEAKSFLW